MKTVPTPPRMSRKSAGDAGSGSCAASRAASPRLGRLLERVFDEDIFVCKRSKGQMRLRAVVVNPPATGRILLGLAKARPPPAFTQA